jgi:hypothetical protein
LIDQTTAPYPEIEVEKNFQSLISPRPALADVMQNRAAAVLQQLQFDS